MAQESLFRTYKTDRLFTSSRWEQIDRAGRGIGGKVPIAGPDRNGAARSINSWYNTRIGARIHMHIVTLQRNAIFWKLNTYVDRNGHARLARGVTHLDHHWRVTVLAYRDRHLDLHHTSLHNVDGYRDHR
jgi:hypothetical protein